MPVAVEMEFSDASLEQYDEVIRRMGYEPCGQGHRDGLFHWAAQVDGGLRIVDVWDTREAFQSFGEEMLGPITAELGVPEPRLTFYEVHNYLYGPRFAR